MLTIGNEMQSIARRRPSAVRSDLVCLCPDPPCAHDVKRRAHLKTSSCGCKDLSASLLQDVTGWGLVGGVQANVDWDIRGAIGYRFNDRISALAGYRALGVDYKKDNFVCDVVQQGPIIGLAIHF